jgi:hypothetical protein
MPAPHLRLKLHFPEDCWILTATAASNVFSGQGRASVEPKALIKFADALAAFPIAAEHAPELLAGSVRDGKLLEAGYDFVRIAIRPLTAKGLLLALIGLGEITSDPTNADRHANSWDRVRSSLLDQPAPYFPYYQAIGVAFPTDYQSIANFASALRGIASGNAEEATLGAAVL